MENPHGNRWCVLFLLSEFFFLIFGASVSTVSGKLLFIIGYVSVMKGGPLVSEITNIETAMVFLDWLKMVCPVFSERAYFLRT